MFKKNMRKDEKLEKAIDSVFEDLDGFTSETDAYASSVDQLVKLYALKEPTAPKRVNPDTLVTAGAHVLAILLIVGVEQHSVVSSKALGLVQKFR